MAVFCAALYTVAVPLTSATYHLHLVVAFTVATIQCGSLVVAVHRPLVGSVLHVLCIVALALAVRDSGAGPWPLPVTGLVSLGALVLLVGIRERWTVSVSVWWLSVVALVAVIAASPARYEVDGEWGTNLTVYASYTATVLVAAIAIGQRHRIRADLAEARRDAELEHAQRLYVEERARIARELHDIVAHSMSVIHMQALSAPYRLPEVPSPAVREEFQDIARSARGALGEMRQMLGALRSEDDEAELAPQPRISDIQQLADATSRAGSPVSVRIDAETGTVSGPVQLTTYRVVQEALSNVVRHAPGAPATVSATLDGGALRICVQNAPPLARAGLPGAPTPDRGGQGIRGMRERLGVLGGQLSVRATADGGYLVDATIPVESAPGEGR
ncbi:sensor histidine kinase [Modestobacter versicolor]|uniref:histidine kinase n=1 Tax=Modestobacter versicolor TaxID=429133 RepID=A0A839XSY2_9ACTN|nr:histidine kinase [Modestobacter versicolor]MBB3674730.1 signal transduction histidine kinase [Modestobacter versicolor]